MERDAPRKSRMKQIVITGAESTGKTTLAKALAHHYNAPFSTEFVREYVERTARNPEAHDLQAIVTGQIASEDAATMRSEDGLVFHDTNLLSTIIYSEHYFGIGSKELMGKIAARSYDLYLLCMPDFPWVADQGQRESAEVRELLHHKFLKQLEALELPFVSLTGRLEDRLKKAVSSIEQIRV